MEIIENTITTDNNTNKPQGTVTVSISESKNLNYEITDSVEDFENYVKDPDFVPFDESSDESDQEPRGLKRKNDYKNEKQGSECAPTCKTCCSTHLPLNRRTEIRQKYWAMKYDERRKWLFHCIERHEKKRVTTKDSRRHMTYIYRLKDDTGKWQNVCKSFFLTTLGYYPKNDKIITTVMKKSRLSDLSPPPDQRGKQTPPNKIARVLITDHIESFKPSISHYRRSHAPNRRYLPSDITINFMYEDFNTSVLSKCSYETYRQTLKEMNISFAKLGEEECELCVKHDNHKKACQCMGETESGIDDGKDNSEVPMQIEDGAYGIIDTDSTEDKECLECETWRKHKEVAKASRLHYQQDAEIEDNLTSVRSVDLQKVIMLPRMPGNKTAVFTKRIIAFNETFAVTGKLTRRNPSRQSVAVVWHEGIAGRKGVEIASSFVRAAAEDRDNLHIIYWLDNCTAQNKNWYLYAAMLSLVHSDNITADDITLKYFEPGHSFMSADSIHHLVELQMKKRPGGKVLDFADFTECVSKSKVNVIRLENSQILDWKHIQSAAKMRKSGVKLTDFVVVQFRRNSKMLYYKLDHDVHEFIELDFLKKDADLNYPRKLRKQDRGIPLEKK
ncbi:hypothetical protein SNE40_009653 [Patella caerulea]|uniref:Uncharacterized protein n=1 Tax=Patella caerulea TaxID=87958 RepID=A0AAN8Q3J3_PATCE